MNKIKRSVLITDLDDTLWSWIEIWYASFYPIINHLVKILEEPEDEILKKIQIIHKKVGTSEYNFLFHDLEKEKTGNTRDTHIKEKYRDAIEAQRYARETCMKPFPKMLETLKQVKQNGTLIVGYTESMAYASMDRLKLFGLDGVLDFLYSREDHKIPDSVELQNYRSRPIDDYSLRTTKHEKLPIEAMKPDPKTLLQIVSNINANIDQCVYIGDNLVKDVKMAKDAKILDIHAKYGESKNRLEYNLLKKVTHWNAKSVSVEAMTTSKEVPASITLNNSFSEILQYIDFTKFSKSKNHG